MPKFLKIILPAVLIGVGVWFLFWRGAISRDPRWAPSIERSSTPFGMLRVYDTESGATLFWYHSDPDAHPIRIDKPDADHWVVVFEKVRK